MLPLGSLGFCLIMCKLSEWNLQCLVINSFMLPSKVSSLWGNIIKSSLCAVNRQLYNFASFSTYSYGKKRQCLQPFKKSKCCILQFWGGNKIIDPLTILLLRSQRNIKKLDFLRNAINRLLFNDFFLSSYSSWRNGICWLLTKMRLDY